VKVNTITESAAVTNIKPLVKEMKKAISGLKIITNSKGHRLVYSGDGEVYVLHLRKDGQFNSNSRRTLDKLIIIADRNRKGFRDDWLLTKFELSYFEKEDVESVIHQFFNTKLEQLHKSYEA
jgi:hypothetical protein